MSLAQAIEYNEFIFPFTILDVSASVVYADDHISVVGTQYVFSISGVLQSLQNFSTTSNSSSLDFMMRAMREALAIPRKTFQVIWSTTATQSGPGQGVPSGSQYIPYSFTGASGGAFNATAIGIDVNWGPKPGELKFTKFSGGLAAMYTWSVSVMVKECFGSQCALMGLNTAILSIVTKYQTTVDGDGLCTRNLSGKLLITSGSVAAGKSADSFRFQITPPIPTNYRRSNQNFEQSEDGRELTFSITDVEMIYTLPTPITDGQAVWSIELADLGAIVNYSLTGWFSAAASQNKSTILTVIANLVQAKFPISDPSLIFMGRTLSESIYDKNRIDFNVTAQGTAGNVAGSSGVSNFAVGLTSLTKSPPDTNGQSTVIYPDGGDAQSPPGIFAPAPVPWDACMPNNPLQSIGQATSGTVPNKITGPPTSAEGNTTAPNQMQPRWMAYKETISYEIDNRIAIFYPKQTGKAPYAQQTGNPRVNVIQAGYAVRAAATSAQGPVAPLPFGTQPGGKSNFTVTNSFLQADVPDPIGDGSLNRYAIHWRFVSTKTTTPVNAFSEIESRYPVDQRRGGTDPNAVAGELYAIPNATLPAPAYTAGGQLQTAQGS